MLKKDSKKNRKKRPRETCLSKEREARSYRGVVEACDSKPENVKQGATRPAEAEAPKAAAASREKYQTAAEQCMHKEPWKPRGSTRELRSLASLARKTANNRPGASQRSLRSRRSARRRRQKYRKYRKPRNTAYNSPGSAQQRPRGSQTLPKPSRNLPQTLPKASLNPSQMLQNFNVFHQIAKNLEKIVQKSRKVANKPSQTLPKPRPNPIKIH